MEAGRREATITGTAQAGENIERPRVRSMVRMCAKVGGCGWLRHVV